MAAIVVSRNALATLTPALTMRRLMIAMKTMAALNAIAASATPHGLGEWRATPTVARVRLGC